MAKFHITHSCGHEATINISGPQKDRARLVEREESKLCRECYMAKLEADRAAENQSNAAQSTNAGFIDLTGTEKQVAWATTIRKEKADLITELIAVNVTNESARGSILAEIINMEPSASYWIETRSASYKDYLRSHPASVELINAHTNK